MINQFSISILWDQALGSFLYFKSYIVLFRKIVFSTEINLDRVSLVLGRLAKNRPTQNTSTHIFFGPESPSCIRKSTKIPRELGGILESFHTLKSWKYFTCDDRRLENEFDPKILWQILRLIFLEWFFIQISGSMKLIID